MIAQTTIPLPIWDAKKYHWKVFLKGTFESLPGCPNWLYETIRQLRTSGQTRNDIVYIIQAKNYQYAVIIGNDDIQVLSKKK